MHTYYISGFAYSDELYHYGIPKMRHGVRRFQNADRTWTEAGKIRYSKAKKKAADGIKRVAGATKNAAKKVGEFAKKQYKKRHPEAMTDEELRAHISRIKLENEYRETMRQNKKPVSTGRRVANEILESSAKTLVSGIVQRMNDRIKDEEAYERKTEHQLEDWKLKDKRDAQLKRREAREEKKTLQYQYDKHVRKSLPKKVKDYTDDDWKKFNDYSKMRSTIRQYEKGKKN